VRERDLGGHDRIVVGRVGRRFAQTVLQLHLETAERRLDVEWRGAQSILIRSPIRHASSAVNLLPVRIGSPLGLLLGDIASPLRSLVGFTHVSPSRVARYARRF
jgi:hypothetical protein